MFLSNFSVINYKLGSFVDYFNFIESHVRHYGYIMAFFYDTIGMNSY